MQVIYVPLLENYRRRCAELQHELDRLSGMRIPQLRQPPLDADDCSLLDDEDLVRLHSALSLSSTPSWMCVRSPALCAHGAAPVPLPCRCAEQSRYTMSCASAACMRAGCSCPHGKLRDVMHIRKQRACQ